MGEKHLAAEDGDRASWYKRKMMSDEQDEAKLMTSRECALLHLLRPFAAKRLVAQMRTVEARQRDAKLPVLY